MNILKEFGISDAVYDFVCPIEENLEARFLGIDKIAQQNFYKIIKAFQDNKVSYECLNGSTGYGYNDLGRETLEKVYADIFKTQSALVRPQITCGTHAISTALFAVLRPGDELISPIGKVYDSLEEVIGKRPSPGSLAEFGVTYKEVALKDDGLPDIDAIKKSIGPKTKMVSIQRSRGYDFRPTLSCEKIKAVIDAVKSVNNDIICFVDNCYGEFVENIEPTEVGADLMAGSLIKNPGGGLAPIGGYIVGREELIELAAARLITPGLGAEVGASLNVLRSFYQGLFNAPTVVSSALKGAILAANVYEKLGFLTSPNGTEERYDIIQAIELKSPEALVAFCKGIQKAAAIDSHLAPIPDDMPGYDSKVIMAAGAFVSGSSIELSADGPLREPYNVFMQGGLNYAHAKLGVILSLQEMYDKGLAVFQ